MLNLVSCEVHISLKRSFWLDNDLCVVNVLLATISVSNTIPINA